METSVNYIIQEMKAISESKIECLINILDITKKQSTAIDNEDIDGLQSFVASKQKLIDSINKLDNEFQSKYLKLKDSLGIKSLENIDMSSYQGVDELKAVVGKIVDILNEISDIEKLNAKNAKVLLDRYAADIKNLSNGRKITSAYNPAPLNVPSYYIDKKK